MRGEIILACCALGCAFVGTETCANSLIAFDAVGRAVGYYAGTCGNDENDWKVYSASGYFACVEKLSGEFDSSMALTDSGIYARDGAFNAFDCAADRYAYSSNPSSGPFYGGFVLFASHDHATYTLNEAKLASVVDLFSAGGPAFNSTCSNFAVEFITYALPSFDNQLAVTGFSSVAYSAPLRIQPAADNVLNDVVFFDGFE